MRYSVKRFGLTKSNKYKTWENVNRKGIIPKEAIKEDENTKLNVNYKWNSVDRYNIVTNNAHHDFPENYKFINKEARNENEYAKTLVKRIDQLINDLKGVNKTGTQYVTTDNPYTHISDCTHMLAKMNTNNMLVYSKNIDDEHRLVYEIHKPKLVNGVMVSDVVIDDINDHTYKGLVYESIGRRTTTNPETGESIVEDHPNFKGRHKSKRYSDKDQN